MKLTFKSKINAFDKFFSKIFFPLVFFVLLVRLFVIQSIFEALLFALPIFILVCAIYLWHKVQVRGFWRLPSLIFFVLRIITVALLWLVSLTYILWLMLDQYTPGQLLSIRLAIPIFTSSIGVILAFRYARYHPMKKKDLLELKPSLKPRDLRHPQPISTLIFIVLVGLSVGGIFLYQEYEDAKRDDLLKDAKDHFVVVHHPNATDDEVEVILIELERTYRHVKGITDELEPADQIRVTIYPTAIELQHSTGISMDAYGLTRCLPSGPEIHLPTEGDGSSDIGISSTPQHEMIHAAVCEILGRNQFNVIPRWFHEGLAEFESTRESKRFAERNQARISVLFSHNDLLEYQSFYSYYPINSDEDIGLFYRTSFEFMRYLVGECGKLAPWTIINKIANGQTFDSAFNGVTGKTCEQMYFDWQEHFYGILH